jgi:multidrug resistance efflux pump
MSDRPTPETDAAQFGTGRVSVEFAKRLERERDEARHKLELCMAANSDVARIAKERDEAREQLSQVYRWIERNQADGFIDSLTYLQNLERVTDDWYDRYDRLEVDACRFVRERDEATAKLAQVSSLTESIVEKANALIARWDQPSWKDTAPTAGFINALRNAVEAYEKTPK